ncbi:MAG: SDR family NAD(P)-dependent oxidoreductase [Solirubrobacteraceae bacterium]
MQVTLDGRIAAVTGAGRGLGRAYALELAGRGAAVLVNDLPGSADAAETVAEIERRGGTARECLADVGTRDGGVEIVRDAVDALGGLDVLVNNAGMLRNGFFEELDEHRLREILAVHLEGPFFASQAAFAAMRERGGGRIVNVSSNTAFGMAGLANYSAAKAGVVGLTRTMALEGRPHGILVNAVMPNAATPIMLEDPIPGFEQDKRFAEAFAAIADRFDVELVAPLVAYLASDACTCSGEVFSALGGRYARVFYGVADGWLSPSDRAASAEEIAEHIEEISEIGERFLTPSSIRDEFEAVAAALRS